MLNQVISYYQNMENLEAQGAPIDWRRVAAAMATNVAKIIEVTTPPEEPDPTPPE